jgi:hypothetical protein
MLPLAARVGESEIDVLHVVFLDHIENFLGHAFNPCLEDGLRESRPGIDRGLTE